MSDSLPPATVRALLHAVFFRWQAWAVTGVWSLWGVLTAIDSQSSRMPEALKVVWNAYYKLPSFGWQTWLIIFLIILTLTALQGSYSFARGYSRRYEEETSHRIIPYVQHDSNARLDTWMQMPAVHAVIALKFENIHSDEVALKKITLRICERLDRGVWELPIRGSDPKVLYQSAVQSWSSDDPPIVIEGFRIKARHITGQPYFLISDQMAFPDYPGQITSSKHFLRLTVEAVAQKPYMVDIEVDWAEPGRWVLSASPVFDTRKVITVGGSDETGGFARLGSKLRGLMRS